MNYNNKRFRPIENSGHPIVGDVKYTSDESNAEFKKFGFKRLMLHAAGLRFTLPDGEELEVRAPLDDSLLRLMDNL